MDKRFKELIAIYDAGRDEKLEREFRHFKLKWLNTRVRLKLYKK